MKITPLGNGFVEYTVNNKTYVYDENKFGSEAELMNEINKKEAQRSKEKIKKDKRTKWQKQI